MSNRDFIRLRRILHEAEITRSLPRAEKAYGELLDLLFRNQAPPDIGLTPFLQCLTYRFGGSGASLPWDLGGKNSYLDRFLLDSVRHGGKEIPPEAVSRLLSRRLEPENREDLSAGHTLSGIMEKIPFLENSGVLPVQFMFRGEPMRSGAGNSGGLWTLLLNLGNSLARSSRTAGVITVAAYDTLSAAYPFVALEFPGPDHALIRLPLEIGGEGYENLLEAQTRIEYAVSGLSRVLVRYVPSANVVFHLRYLDPASVASARAAGPYGIPRVLTLTPDPHRLIGIDRDTPGLEQLSKILAGDELIALSRGIIGIGRHSIARSLVPYFPVLENTEERLIQGIDEGIRLHTGEDRAVTDPGFSDGDITLKISKENRHRPVLLNVGRLHPAKGQEALVRGWAEYGLWERYNLVFIGGDIDNPSPQEAEFIEWFDDYMDQAPHLRGRAAHIGARPNDEVRRIQTFLGMNSDPDAPNAYVCPSLKEEFGISILEAMSAGMIVFAPVLGGAPEYIRHRINGFLIDTSGPETIGRELRTYLVENRPGPKQIEAVRRLAEETIRLRYSLDKISGDFIDFYCRLGEE